MTAHWFCLKTQTKREHIAADHVGQFAGVEVFLPRIRFQRKTARGKVWFTEALFPGYLFAKFDFQVLVRQIQHAPGVRGVVHFGDHWPAVPEAAVLELQHALGGESLFTVNDPLVPGEEVEVGVGAFRGLKGVITRVMPARDRVLVLLEFLGRQTGVEISAADLVREGEPRRRALRGGAPGMARPEPGA
jgi:transcriptional antiterminator RfaH